jgi:V/A-type H+-transporting ATPase subunit E
MMENKLQQLTRKLYDEGLEKGRSDAERLISEAKSEAAKIVATAQEEAAAIVKAAEAKAADTAKNSLTEVRLAGKQAVAHIKEELSTLLIENATSGAVKAANLDPDFVKAMLLSVAHNWNGATSGKVDLQALLPETERERFDAAFVAATKELLEAGVEVGYSKEVRTGFKVGAKGGSYYISFSDDDFEALLKEYLRGKVSELLFKA